MFYDESLPVDCMDKSSVCSLSLSWGVVASNGKCIPI